MSRAPRTIARVGPFERHIGISPAWDRRSSNPDKNYGIHCAELVMVLKGPRGAVQFVLYTGWHLPDVAQGLQRRGLFAGVVSEPLPANVGYHSPVPQFVGHSPMKSECTYVDGGRCYYDGSSFAAVEMFGVLVREGDDGVWAKLEERYRAQFGDPEAHEAPTP